MTPINTPKQPDPAFKGTIIRYFADIRMGTIKGDSGESYTFQGAEWKAEGEPKVDQRVSFQLEGLRAVNILPAE
ncbi:MAG TPA: hypothetical protein VL625_03265 [Patescibacteria group bacterium]|nr:hypothetical protein [Patescibacteria group bacterium]